MPKKTKLAAVPAALPPARAALAEHRTALAAAETQHQTAAAHAAKLRELIEGPVKTEQEIRARIASDAAALRAWVESGSIKTEGRPAFEWAGREELEDRLVAQRHAGEIAAAALVDADAEVARMAGVVAEIRGKIAEAERGVVLEVADEIGR